MAGLLHREKCMNLWTPEKAADDLALVREKHPLVHNITNYVVMNSTANMLLALGASPVMAHAVEEVEEMAALAGALVLNIGTLSAPWITSMFKAGRAAEVRGVPVVLDPVGAGATTLRTDTARKLLDDVHPAVVRGNASEILALCGSGGARGVDAQHPVDAARAKAKELARARRMVVAVTGAEDYVTDGERGARIANGHPLMGRVTGTGCAATAVTGAFCAIQPDAFLAAVSALVVFGLAGERAARGAPRPGTFAVCLVDALDELDRPLVQSMARVVLDP